MPVYTKCTSPTLFTSFAPLLSSISGVPPHYPNLPPILKTTSVNFCISKMSRAPSSLSQEVLENILEHLDFGDLNAFAACSRQFRNCQNSYFLHRLIKAFAFYHLSLPSLLATLHHTGALIGGSFVLSLLLAASSLSWTPASLDIFISYQQTTKFCAFLLESGYNIDLLFPTQIPSSMRSQISSLEIYSFQDRTIKLFSSCSLHSITPIVHAPLTCLFNFISASSIYVLYPQLTLRSLCLINPFLAYKCSLKRDVLSFLSKYNSRGFVVCQCASIHHYLSPCKTTICHPLDTSTLQLPLFDYLRTPLPAKFPSFLSGEKHVVWKLGGCGCTKQNRLVWPYIRTRCNPVSVSTNFHLTSALILTSPVRCQLHDNI